MSISSEIRLVFISASPVLVNEVKRFYLDFKDHFTQELVRVRAGKPQEDGARVKGHNAESDDV